MSEVFKLWGSVTVYKIEYESVQRNKWKWYWKWRMKRKWKRTRKQETNVNKHDNGRPKAGTKKAQNVSVWPKVLRCHVSVWVLLSSCGAVGPPTAFPSGHRCTVGIDWHPPMCLDAKGGIKAKRQPFCGWCCQEVMWLGWGRRDMLSCRLDVGTENTHTKLDWCWTILKRKKRSSLELTQKEQGENEREMKNEWKETWEKTNMRRHNGKTWNNGKWRTWNKCEKKDKGETEHGHKTCLIWTSCCGKSIFWSPPSGAKKKERKKSGKQMKNGKECKNKWKENEK